MLGSCLCVRACPLTQAMVCSSLTLCWLKGVRDHWSAWLSVPSGWPSHTSQLASSTGLLGPHQSSPGPGSLVVQGSQGIFAALGTKDLPANRMPQLGKSCSGTNTVFKDPTMVIRFCSRETSLRVTRLGRDGVAGSQKAELPLRATFSRERFFHCLVSVRLCLSFLLSRNVDFPSLPSHEPTAQNTTGPRDSIPAHPFSGKVAHAHAAVYVFGAFSGGSTAALKETRNFQT